MVTNKNLIFYSNLVIAIINNHLFSRADICLADTHAGLADHELVIGCDCVVLVMCDIKYQI